MNSLKWWKNGVAQGEMFVMTAQRNVGKSMVMTMLKQRQLTHNMLYPSLCNEIIMPQQWTMRPASKPQTNKYQFSRQWYTVDLDEHAQLEWCRETFGREPLRPDAWSRWTHDWSSIKFRDAQDYEWYRLRWGV